MKLKDLSPYREGAFATIYKATDNLGRSVAVKIISKSMAQVSDALRHAKALVGAAHPNVVAVYSVEKITDPKTNTKTDAIVMEFLEGQTLSEYLKRNLLQVIHIKSISQQLIDGLSHIHKNGGGHGDLHLDNIMICDDTLKLLDILSYKTATPLSTSLAELKKRDQLSLVSVLVDIIKQSELDQSEVSTIHRELVKTRTLTELSTRFNKLMDDAFTGADERSLDFALQRFEDSNFVKGAEYAAALMEETKPKDYVPLLETIIDRGLANNKHHAYLVALWSALDDHQKKKVLAKLSVKLDSEITQGRWFPHVFMLTCFGEDGYRGLRKIIRLRLEEAMTNDVLTGNYDIFSLKKCKSGALGTWASEFYRYFDNKDRLIENIASMLMISWYTQNYIATYFWHILPELVEERGRDKIMAGLYSAINNDARIVKDKLSMLPASWQKELKSY